jgi:enoyl-CoA hydratase
MSEPVVLVERSEGVALVTLNRPKAMNALSRELRGDLTKAFVEIEADDDIEVSILTGAGDRAFCAGLDLKELAGETGAGTVSGGDVVEDGANVVRAMEQSTKPIIGAINGVAITGGFELALACDILVGSTAARFSDTHARVGIMPGWGLSQKLSRLVGIYRAKELSLTGNFLDSEQAEAWGLLNRVVEPAELLDVCRALAQDIRSCQRPMVAAYKGVIDRGFAETYAAGRSLERDANRAAMSKVSPDAIRAVRGQVMERGRTQSRD